MKIKYLTPFLLVFSIAHAHDTDFKKEVTDKVNAKSFVTMILPQKIDGQIYTPLAAQYFQGNDFMPSCSLFNREDVQKQLELIAPSEGQFGNCHQVITKPTVSKINADYYATYRYVVEDPRNEFTPTYQLVKLTKDGFYKCKEDSAINKSIDLSIKKKISVDGAVKSAIKKIGCTVDEKTFD
ncbi:hypothetical protein [Collimonas humicola]|uniref:hypothetical protein n=1 Tax=Collimonas humicola TaxID=2825886 RepID=UPI001B8AD8FB|nr:hypothetical protein [Collimonas humicola]